MSDEKDMHLFMKTRLPFTPDTPATHPDAPASEADQAPVKAARFILCSANVAHGQWLADVLHDWEPLLQRPMDPTMVAMHLVKLDPQLVFLDFSGEHPADAEAAFDPTALAQTLREAMPEVPLVALGLVTRPEGTIAALRAGVHDFLDTGSSVEDARETVLKALMRVKLAAPPPPAAAPAAPGKMIALIGVRAGVGTSTLAAHLADLAQRHCAAGHGGASRVALLDLGLPAGDGQLYLNTSGNFHFVDAVHNLRRFDDTFINTALARSADGVTVLSLPRNLADMRGVGQEDALALLERLRRYFDVLIVDLGGFTNAEFIAGMKNAADEAWLVTDQSVGALVSLSNTIAMLNAQQRIVCANLHLIVNRYDERYGMSATQIAARFDIPLLAAIPESTLGLMSSSSQGKLLHHIARRDRYVQAVEELVTALVAKKVEAQAGGLAKWLPKGKR